MSEGIFGIMSVSLLPGELGSRLRGNDANCEGASLKSNVMPAEAGTQATSMRG